MRKYFYYHRDNNRAPLVTVCLIKWRTVVCRGVAICSPLDNPEKQEGRNRAEGRALTAYKRKKTTEEILRDEAVNVLNNASVPWDLSFKSEYNPSPTDFERQLIAKA